MMPAQNIAPNGFLRFLAPAAAWLLAIVPSPSARAADNDPADLRAALEAWQAQLGRISSISSDFVQEKHMTLFQDALMIRGRMFIGTHGRFAWETHWPMRYKMVVGDGSIRQWDEETGRVQSISMRDNPAASAIHDHMSAWFSGQYHSLTNTYIPTLAASNPVSLLFTPHAGSPASTYLASVQVWLRADRRYLERLRIVERNGDYMDIGFTNTVLNGALPADAWTVSLPAAPHAVPPGAAAPAPGTRGP